MVQILQPTCKNTTIPRLEWMGTNIIIASRFRAKREQLKMLCGHLPQRQGQNLALTVSCVPYSLEIGRGTCLLDARQERDHGCRDEYRQNLDQERPEPRPHLPSRYRVTSEHSRQSRPDSGLGLSHFKGAPADSRSDREKWPLLPVWS